MLKKCMLLLLLASGQGVYSQEPDYCENGSYGNQLIWIEALMSGDFFHPTGPFHNNYGDQDHLYVGYDDQTDQVIQWQAGLNELVLVPGRFDQPWMDDYPSQWQVWIDFNLDLVFAPDERVLALSSLDMLIETIDLSEVVIDGDMTTRMRVSSGLYEGAPSCGSIGHGEVEDYTVVISAPSEQTWQVPEQFNSIQAAVDAASEGDRVLVNDGTYLESVVIDKALRLESVNGSEQTVISGSTTAHTIEVQAPDVTIKGFAIENLANASVADVYFAPGADRGQVLQNQCANMSVDAVDDSAVFIDQANDVKVSGLLCEGQGYLGIRAQRMAGGQFTDNVISGQSRGGIYALRSDQVLVEDNELINNNVFGVYASRVTNATISRNHIADNVELPSVYNSGMGINLYFSESVVVKENHVLDNESYGLSAFSSSHVSVLNNISMGNLEGFNSGTNDHVNIANNVFNGNARHGLGLYGNEDFEVINNELSFNDGSAIHLSRSRSGALTDNEMLDNFRAFSLRESQSVTFTGNRFQAPESVGDPCQVLIYQSSFNRFFLNSFFMNQADFCSDSLSSNQWVSQDALNYVYQGTMFTRFLGNYFSDGETSDGNGDGVASQIYALPGNNQYDPNPLVSPASAYIVE